MEGLANGGFRVRLELGEGFWQKEIGAQWMQWQDTSTYIEV